MAFRILEGVAEVNFSHRSHAWHPCKLVQNTSCPLQQLSGRYVLNQALLDGVFEISSMPAANRPISHDALGGSSSASQALPLHAEPAKILEPTNTSLTELQAVEERISLFQGVCCDWKHLLCCKPELWFLLPCPFSLVDNPGDWDTAMAAAVHSFSEIVQSETLNAAANDLSRVEKRLRVYIGTLRKNMKAILEQPEFLKCAPNPCDSSMAKRSWEQKMLALRRAWSSAGGRNPATDPDGSAQAAPHSSHGGHGAVNDLIGAGMDPVAYLQHRLLFGRALRSNSAILKDPVGGRNCGTFMQLCCLCRTY